MIKRVWYQKQRDWQGEIAAYEEAMSGVEALKNAVEVRQVRSPGHHCHYTLRIS